MASGDRQPRNSCAKCKLAQNHRQLTQESAELLRRHEDMVRRAQRLDLIYRHVTHGIAIHEVVMDQDGHPCDYRFVDANPAFEQIAGVGREAMEGRRALDLLPGLEKTWIELYAQTAITGKPLRLEKYSASRGKWLEITLLTPKPDLFVTMVADITEQKASEDRARRAAELAEAASIAKSRFLATMSHEIRTPMTAIIGFLQVMLDTRLTDEQQDYIASAKSSSDNLVTLINDILDFSKIEAGRMELSAVDFSVEKLLLDTAEMFRLQLKQKNLELECCVEDPALPKTLNGDPLRLKQVLINLLGNAIKFTEKGKISLKMSLHSQTEDSVILLTRVEDTGIGIPDEKRNHLMQLFAQGDPTVSQKFGGSGLGLAISKRLAIMMGGALRFESVAGQGTLFYFTAHLRKAGLPARPAPEPKKDIPAMPAIPRRAPLHMRILAAEDTPSNQKLIAIVLNTIGCETVIAENGQIAVDEFEKGGFDAVLMDIQMPVMDGIQAMLAIKQLAAQKKQTIPVIALTAKALEEDRRLCLNAGMDGYIAKPISIDSLYAELRKYSPGNRKTS